MTGRVTARIDAGFHTRIAARAHGINADEPLSLNGTDRGMTPYELLLASLSSCMALTMRMYADHKGWPLQGAVVQLRTAPSRNPDADVRSSGAKSVTRIERHIELAGELTDEQRALLYEVAPYALAMAKRINRKRDRSQRFGQCRRKRARRLPDGNRNGRRWRCYCGDHQ